MRSLRSSFATTRMAPSSTLLRPIFQASATRIEYCSMVSGCVVGTISTATWLPLRASKSCSVLSSEAISPLLSVAVLSTMRPVSGGTATSASAANAKASISASSEALATFIAKPSLSPRLFGWRGGRGRGIEVDLGRCGNFLFVLDRKVRLFLIAEHHRSEVGRDRADGDVIVLYRLDVAVARHRDAVLGALQLGHQIPEQRIRFQLRIVFGDHQKPRQRAGELALRLLEFLEGGGIVQHVLRSLHAADLGARVGDAEQHVLFLLRKALDGIDQVRDQVGAALILIDDFGPARLDLLVLALDRVISAIGQAQRRQRRQHGQDFPHSSVSLSSRHSGLAPSGAPRNDGDCCSRPSPHDRRHFCALASRIACHTFIGVSGVVSAVMPRSPSASITPLTTQGGPPMAPDSPQPLAPSGLVRQGADSSSVTSIGGTSSARGMQ